MRAAFAFLTPRFIENAVNQLAWHTHQTRQASLRVRRLPPHISLKQPFTVSDFEALQRYFSTFAASVPPFTVTLSGVAVWESVLAVAVEETPTLRGLHDRLNTELSERFGNVAAQYDGDAYRFHLTIVSGGATKEIYRALCADYLKDPPSLAFASFTVREIALFVYDEPTPGKWEYLPYTILPLSGNPA